MANVTLRDAKSPWEAVLATAAFELELMQAYAGDRAITVEVACEEACG